MVLHGLTRIENKRMSRGQFVLIRNNPCSSVQIRVQFSLRGWAGDLRSSASYSLIRAHPRRSAAKFLLIRVYPWQSVQIRGLFSLRGWEGDLRLSAFICVLFSDLC